MIKGEQGLMRLHLVNVYGFGDSNDVTAMVVVEAAGGVCGPVRCLKHCPQGQRKKHHQFWRP